ncbi:MAG: NADH-quinone oxidoreductase subunit NuoE [Bacteroidota bacterium]
MLTEKEKEEIMEDVRLVPYPAAACIDALKIVQEHRGWISDESLEDIAAFLGMPPADVDSVATFYTRIYRKPVGRNVILVCDSVTCMMLGYLSIYEYFSEKLGIRFGETTSDGRYTLLPVSCLGNCDHAASIMINNDLYSDLQPSAIDALLEKYS